VPGANRALLVGANGLPVAVVPRSWTVNGVSPTIDNVPITKISGATTLLVMGTGLLGLAALRVQRRG